MNNTNTSHSLYAKVRHLNVKKLSNFRVLTATSAILHGSYSMNDKRFKLKSRGKQGISCCVIAIVYSHLFEPTDWTKKDLNHILEYGDKLFHVSETRDQVDPSMYRTTSKIYPEFYIGNYKCLISIESKKVYGNLFTESIECPSFGDGLQQFLKNNTYGVVTAQTTSIAIWHHPGYGYFYFDPTSCTELGSHCPNGSACVIRFECVRAISDLFLSNFLCKQDLRYCIDKITILRIIPIKPLVDLNCHLKIDNDINPSNYKTNAEKKVDCAQLMSEMGEEAVQSPFINRKLLLAVISNYNLEKSLPQKPFVHRNFFDTDLLCNNMKVNVPSTFEELPNYAAILHGWTHELNELYKGKGMQNIANCITAIAVKKYNPVRTWIRSTLDHILTLGDTLHADVARAKSALKSLTAIDFNDVEIQIERKKMAIGVDLMTVIGKIISKIPSVLNLKQGLQKFFSIHKDGIIECSLMAVATWMQDDGFYIFNPRQCNSDGVAMSEKETKSTRKQSEKNLISTDIKNAKGKCCVMRFSSVPDLVTHLLKCVSTTKRNDRFTICHITVTDDVSGHRPWYNFQPSEYGAVWILRGNIANDAEEFEEKNLGVQGLAMPVAALINAHQTPPKVWTAETIDDIIRTGNKYFTWCIPSNQEENRHLTVERLRKRFYWKNRRIEIGVDDSSIIGNFTPITDRQMPNLEKAIAQFFETHQFGILEIKNVAIALWKYEEELKDKTKLVGYYCFNAYPDINISESTSVDVIKNTGGCVFRCVDCVELARAIVTIIAQEADGSNDFFIHKFKLVSIGILLNDKNLEEDKQVWMKPNFNRYGDLAENGACLNGNIDQGNEIIFKPKTRNKQQAANALIALVMKQLYNPHLWYPEVVDDILKLGTKLTEENFKNIEEVKHEDQAEEESLRNYLLPSEITGTFNIGMNKVTVTLKEEKLRGPVADLAQLLVEFFAGNSMGILRQDNVMLPIWKEVNVYFLMDPKGRDHRGQPVAKGGTAAVLWFTTIASLASAIVLSLSKPESNLIIDAVTLHIDNEIHKKSSDITPFEDCWYNFFKKCNGIWELVGSIAASDKLDEKNRGKQRSVYIATMAIFFSKIYRPRYWTAEIINQIIATGDKLYDKSISSNSDSLNLSFSKVINEFFLCDRHINITLTDCIEAGNVAGKYPKAQNLEIGIENFFKKYICGILTIYNDIYITIWKSEDHYYCFYSNILPTNHDGFSSIPTALRVTTPELLSRYIKTIYSSAEDYEISAVDITNWKTLSTTSDDSSLLLHSESPLSLNAFIQFEPHRRSAILYGSTHQASEVFFPHIQNKQTAASCIVALGMSVVKNPIYWTKNTIDEILVIGSNLYLESLKFQSSKEKLQPYDIVRVFHIGVNVLVADVDQSTISGQIAIPPPQPESQTNIKSTKKSKKVTIKTKKPRKAPPPPPSVIFLEQGLHEFFENNRAGILITDSLMITLWKHQGLYFLYNPHSSKHQGLSDAFDGACAIWFTSMKFLYNLILSYVKETERYGQYLLSRVIIQTNIIEPLPAPGLIQTFSTDISLPISTTSVENHISIQPAANMFHVIDGELSVFVGSTSMCNQVFSARVQGPQSTAVAAVAIVIGLLYVPSTWTPQIIDCILKYGNILYEKSVRMIRSGLQLLFPSELLTTFIIGDVEANIDIHPNTTTGLLQIEDLAEALEVFFKNNCAGILYAENLAVAVMQHCGKFYMFDSSRRSKDSTPNFSGATGLIKCENIMRMVSLFVINCSCKAPTIYTISPVTVRYLKFFLGERNHLSCCELQF